MMKNAIDILAYSLAGIFFLLNIILLILWILGI